MSEPGNKSMSKAYEIALGKLRHTLFELVLGVCSSTFISSEVGIWSQLWFGSTAGEQAGFRKERLCRDHIATLRIILVQSLEWSSPRLHDLRRQGIRQRRQWSVLGNISSLRYPWEVHHPYTEDLRQLQLQSHPQWGPFRTDWDYRETSRWHTVDPPNSGRCRLCWRCRSVLTQSSGHAFQANGDGNDLREGGS